MRSPVVLKERPVYLFSQGAGISVCVPAVGRLTDTLTGTILGKNPEVACLCVHVNWGLTTKKLGHVLFSDTCHTWADSSRLCLFSPQPSQPSRGKSVPGVRRDLSAPEGIFFKQNKRHFGLLNGWQSSPGCQTQRVKCFWLC